MFLYYRSKDSLRGDYPTIVRVIHNHNHATKIVSIEVYKGKNKTFIPKNLVLGIDRLHSRDVFNSKKCSIF